MEKNEQLEPVTGQKHSRLTARGAQKGKPFWGEDEVRSECVFAAGGNKRYEAAEDEERFVILLVFSCSPHPFFCHRQRGTVSQLTAAVRLL